MRTARYGNACCNRRPSGAARGWLSPLRQRIGKRVRSGLALLFGLTTFCLAASAADPGAETRLKEPLAGLVQMGAIGFHRQDGGVAKPGLAALQRFPGLFGGMVIN